MTLSDPYARFLGHGVIIDAIDVLCAQLTRDPFAIAKFLLQFIFKFYKSQLFGVEKFTLWDKTK